MATKAPVYHPINQYGTVSINDPALAQINRLLTIDRNQHALMSGHGGPATYSSLDIVCEDATTPVYGFLLARVPPGVTHVHIGLVVTGRGRCRVKSATSASVTIDGEGAYLTWAPDEVDPTLLTPEHATVTATTKVDDTGTDTPRAVVVSASSSGSWTTVILGLEVEALDGTYEYARVWGAYVSPIHNAVTAA